MAGIGEIFRSIGDTFFRLDKKPTYRDWLGKARQAPGGVLPVSYGPTRTEAMLVLVMPVDQKKKDRLAFSVKGKGSDSYLSQELDLPTLKLIRPIESAQPGR